MTENYLYHYEIHLNKVGSFLLGQIFNKYFSNDEIVAI